MIKRYESKESAISQMRSRTLTTKFCSISSEQNIGKGVLQGSILSHILFLIYISDSTYAIIVRCVGNVIKFNYLLN